MPIQPTKRGSSANEPSKTSQTKAHARFRGCIWDNWVSSLGLVDKTFFMTRLIVKQRTLAQVVAHEDGDVYSKCGTYLGSLLPDEKGPRSRRAAAS